MELFIKLVACKDSQNKINLLLSKESVTKQRGIIYHLWYLFFKLIFTNINKTVKICINLKTNQNKFIKHFTESLSSH